jgi:hypothetical protein
MQSKENDERNEYCSLSFPSCEGKKEIEWEKMEVKKDNLYCWEFVPKGGIAPLLALQVFYFGIIYYYF